MNFFKAGWRPACGWIIALLLPVLFGLIPLLQVIKTGEVQEMIYYNFFMLASLLGGGLVAARSIDKKNGVTK